MTHFYHSKNLFLDKTEESMVLNGRETEYIRFDYDYDEEILPHLINTFTNRRVRATRKLENIRLFNRKSIIGMVLRDFEFMDTQSLNELSGITMNSDMRKDDKILGAQRIPYIGEGKNSRYYVPLLKAYKNKDMKKVKELELEMRQMEQNI